MSEEIVCDPAAEDGAEFADLLQARCPEMQVLTGAVGSTSSRERSHSEIQIVIPGERAVAEIAYRTPEGSVRRQAMSERQISIIPAGQPHQLLCARGTDLTVVRIASDLLKRIARESGMRAVEVVGQYGTAQEREAAARLRAAARGRASERQRARLAVADDAVGER